MDSLLLTVLRRADVEGADIFTADEVSAWPAGATAELIRAGLLVEIEPAKEVLCLECDEGCWIQPRIQDDPRTGKPIGVYFCRRNEDVGRFYVDLSRRARWRFDLTGLARVISAATDAVGRVSSLVDGRLTFLDTASIDGKKRELFLARGVAWPDAAQVFGNCSRLKMASHPAVLTLAAMPSEPLLEGCDLAVRPLVEITRFVKGRMKIGLDDAFPEVEPGPWANLPNKPITLDMFMARFCEKQKGTYIIARRKGLLAAARNRSVKLPGHVMPWTSGQAKKYFTHDLLNSWRGFIDENVDLPPLLSQYQASSVFARISPEACT